MTYKEAKAYLDAARHSKFQLDRIELDIKRIRTEMQSPLGGLGSGDKVQTSKTNSVEKRLVKYLELLEKHEEAWLECKQQYVTRLYETENRILQMPDGKPRDFLLAHYIDGVSELDFGLDHGYVTTGSVYNLKRRAIKNFADCF